MGTHKQELIEPAQLADFQVRHSRIILEITAPEYAPMFDYEASKNFDVSHVTNVTGYGTRRTIYANDCAPMEALKEYARITQEYFDAKNAQFNEEYEQ